MTFQNKSSVDWDARKETICDLLWSKGAASSKTIERRTGIPIQGVRWCLRMLIATRRVRRITIWHAKCAHTYLYGLEKK